MVLRWLVSIGSRSCFSVSEIFFQLLSEHRLLMTLVLDVTFVEEVGKVMELMKVFWKKKKHIVLQAVFDFKLCCS